MALQEWLLVIKIAWRNLSRHRGKSIIIGMIVFFAALFMSFGNAVTTGTNENLKRNIAGQFTGDILLISTNLENDNILFDEIANLFEINEFSNIRAFLEKQPSVEKFLPMAYGYSLVLENESSTWSVFTGVEFEDFQKFFGSNVIIIEGTSIKKGERGLLFSRRWRERIYGRRNFWVLPENLLLKDSELTADARSNLNTLDVKTNLVIMGLSQDEVNQDIRIPVKGIVTYKDFNEFWGYFNFMDIESFRECFNYNFSRDDSKISKSQKKLMEMEDENFNNLFNDNVIENSIQNDGVPYQLKHLKKNTPGKSKISIENGSYNVIAVKIKNVLSIDNEVKKLNSGLEKAGLSVKAISWNTAGGVMAVGTNMLTTGMFVFILFLYFVTIIVIMNTLNMAVIERVDEIAMIRSIGGQKNFVAKFFTVETLILTLSAGVLGIIAGAVLTHFIRGLGITVTDQEMAALFFGSDHFTPFFGLKEGVICFVELLFFSSLAILYPVHLARKINPLEAIAKE
jgi:ABC-type lipoprotein release transport system permease subunit